MTFLAKYFETWLLGPFYKWNYLFDPSKSYWLLRCYFISTYISIISLVWTPRPLRIKTENHQNVRHQNVVVTNDDVWNARWLRDNSHNIYNFFGVYLCSVQLWNIWWDWYNMQKCDNYSLNCARYLSLFSKVWTSDL